jgi:hypothetical protein
LYHNPKEVIWHLSGREAASHRNGAIYIQCVPKKPKSIEINALFEFECPLNLNAKMRKIFDKGAYIKY